MNFVRARSARDAFHRGGQRAAAGRAAAAVRHDQGGLGLSAARCAELFDAQLASRARRSGRPLAAVQGGRLLHDRLVRPRGQRGRGRCAAADRPGDAALPFRRLLPGPVRPGQAAPGRRERRTARARRGRRRADRRRQAQGIRPPRAERDPADLDDRLAPAARRRPGLRAAARGQARAGRAVAGATRWWSAASATRRPITRPRPARSTPPPTAATRDCRCRCCWSARTTGWASASAPRPAGSGPPSRAGPGVRYFLADGSDLAAVYDTAVSAAAWVRERRAPAFLHISTVRFGGHAGSDVESGYRAPAEIAADLRRDPLLGTARLLVESGTATPARGAGQVRGEPGSGCSRWPRRWRARRGSARPRR